MDRGEAMGVERINYQMNEKYISDGIKEGYTEWEMRKPLNSSTKVFIESPTGTGKTSFIINTLLPYAAKHNRSILYIGNRVAIKEQTENILECNCPQLMYDLHPKSGETTFWYPQTYTCITLLNYQSALSFKKEYQYYYVIFDEVHFFLEDALFNAKTSKIYDYLMTKYMDSVNIFMSATIGEFVELFDKTYKNYTPPHIVDKYSEEENNINKHAMYHWNLRHYINTYARPSYHVVLYDKNDYLYDAIRKTPKDEKWLIFVSSKHNGDLLKKDLSNKTNKKCCFLTAQSKKTKTWETLVETSYFNEDVLIATKVLDNGVNIKSSSIKHVVVPFSDSTEFIQMIGRRRILNDDHYDSHSDEKTNSKGIVNLYIKQPTVQEINAKLMQYNRMLKTIIIVEDCLIKDSLNKNNNLVQKMIIRFWNDCDKTINNLFNISFRGNSIKLEVNALAREKLSNLIKFYENLSSEYKNPNLYYKYISKFLGASIVGVTNANLSKDDETLICFLDNSIGQRIDNTDMFYNSFIELYKKYCYEEHKRNNKDDEWLKGALNIRKGKTQRKATINRSIEYLELPYYVKKSNNCWIIEKIYVKENS